MYINLQAVLLFVTLITKDVTSLQCYQCFINPPNDDSNSSNQLCVHFDYSSRFIVDCPESTMCAKQVFHMEIQNGVRIDGVLRECARQKYKYQEYKNGKWSPKIEILEPYQEGCIDVDGKGQRTPPTSSCYCRSDLCNAAPPTNHEGYTDIMGVIVVFNLMKFINSVR